MTLCRKRCREFDRPPEDTQETPFINKEESPRKKNRKDFDRPPKKERPECSCGSIADFNEQGQPPLFCHDCRNDKMVNVTPTQDPYDDPPDSEDELETYEPDEQDASALDGSDSSEKRGQDASALLDELYGSDSYDSYDSSDSSDSSDVLMIPTTPEDAARCEEIKKKLLELRPKYVRYKQIANGLQQGVDSADSVDSVSAALGAVLDHTFTHCDLMEEYAGLMRQLMEVDDSAWSTWKQNDFISIQKDSSKHANVARSLFH